MSVAQLVFIWHNHSIWSRKFGLEDTRTVVLSVSLLIVVLIYIYPLKIMFEGLFSWLTQGLLPSNFALENYTELRYLFYYFAIGFLLISLIFLALYRHALNLKSALKLSPFETFSIHTSLMVRTAMVIICVLALIIPALLPDKHVPLAGFTYSLLWPTIALIEKKRLKKWRSYRN